MLFPKLQGYLYYWKVEIVQSSTYPLVAKCVWQIHVIQVKSTLWGFGFFTKSPAKVNLTTINMDIMRSVAFIIFFIVNINWSVLLEYVYSIML